VRLDFRIYLRHPDGRAEDWLQSLSGIVVDVLDPEKSFQAWQQMKSMC
jgi:hypothetical protein